MFDEPKNVLRFGWKHLLGLLALAVVIVFLSLGHLAIECAKHPFNCFHRESLWDERKIPPPSEPSSATLPLTLPLPLESKFFPSGWMGDGRYGRRYLSANFVSEDVNGQATIVCHVQYERGPDGWAGLYWQHPDGNWGTQPGMSLVGASAIAFVARGEVGGEMVEFKVGGIRGIYRDSVERSLGKVSLRRSWTPYEIQLSDADLSNVIGAFAWSAPAPATRMSFSIANLQIR